MDKRLENKVNCVITFAMGGAVIGSFFGTTGMIVLSIVCAMFGYVYGGK